MLEYKISKAVNSLINDADKKISKTIPVIGRGCL
jgi:hypothetical protein